MDVYSVRCYFSTTACPRAAHYVRHRAATGCYWSGCPRVDIGGPVRPAHELDPGDPDPFREPARRFQIRRSTGPGGSATAALKRAKHDKPYSFKKKGNEEQATFNARIDEALAETQSTLAGAGTSPALERAQQSLERGRKLLAERQKLIRIADRSEFR